VTAFYLFGGIESYERNGGVNDLLITATSKKDIYKKFAERYGKKIEWAHIADESMNICDSWSTCWGPLDHEGWLSDMSKEDKEWWKARGGCANRR